MKKKVIFLSVLAFLFLSAVLSAPVLSAEYGILKNDPSGEDGSLEGYVTDSATGYSIYGAVVRIDVGDDYFTTVTDSAGYYKIRLPAGRGYPLMVTKTSYERAEAITPPISVGGVAFLDLEVTPLAGAQMLAGTVSNVKGDPLPGVRLLISGTQLLTDANGYYEIELTEGGGHTLLAQCTGFGDHFESGIAISSEAPTILNITMQEKVALGSANSGDDETPASHGKVSVTPPPAMEDSAGVGCSAGTKSFGPGSWWALIFLLGPLPAALLLRKKGAKASGRELFIAGILISSAVLCFYSCGSPEVGSDGDVFDNYSSTLLGDGNRSIHVYEQPATLPGPLLDYFSLDNTTVLLRRSSDGELVDGSALGFDLKDCALGEASCAKGAAFLPGGGSPCDLDGDTAYELLLDGVLGEDGLPLNTLLIPFRTLPVPAGHTPDFCSDREAGWWLVNYFGRDDGIKSTVTGSVSIVIAGVDSRAPYNNYEAFDSPEYAFAAYYQPGGYVSYNKSNMLISPPYIPVLKIYNNSDGPYELSGADAVALCDGQGRTLEGGAALPHIELPAWETLLLYVAEDGSTYYMYDDGSGGHTLDLVNYPSCRDGSGGCPVLDPEEALAEGPAAVQ